MTAVNRHATRWEKDCGVTVRVKKLGVLRRINAKVAPMGALA